MALSGTRTFIYTRDDIIKDALKKLHVIVQGGTPSADQTTGASNALNILQIDLQNKKGITLWSDTDIHKAITASTPKVIASSAADTIDIFNVIFRANGVDTLLNKISKEEYQSLPVKNEAGNPTSYWVEYLLDSTNIYLYPAYGYTTSAVTGSDGNVYIPKLDHTSVLADNKPISGTDYSTYWEATTQISTGGAWADDTDYYSSHIRFVKTQRLQDMTDAAHNPDFHVRVYKTMILLLTAYLAPEYCGINVSRFWEKQAKEALEDFLSGSNDDSGDIQFIPRIG